MSRSLPAAPCRTDDERSRWKRVLLLGLGARRASPLAAAGLLLGVLLGLSGAVAAHSLQLFAMAEGDRISGRAYFAGGHPARGAQIQVLTAAGELLATLTPDAEGAFAYRTEAARDLLIVAQSADGHRAEWPIAAAELSGAFAVSDSAAEASPAATLVPSSEVRAEPPDAAERARQAHPSASAQAATGQVFSGRTELLQATGRTAPERLDPTVLAAIEQAVARQVRPLREALARRQAQAQLRDILGGIGYILGIAGLGIWWTARRRRRAERPSWAAAGTTARTAAGPAAGATPEAAGEPR